MPEDEAAGAKVSKKKAGRLRPRSRLQVEANITPGYSRILSIVRIKRDGWWGVERESRRGERRG